MRRALSLLATLVVSGGLLAAVAVGAPTVVRDAVVYPARVPNPRFQHSQPAHAAQPCVACHGAAQDSAQVGDDLLPREPSCQPCHASAMDRSRTTRESCGLCHPGFDPAQSTAVPEPNRTAARLHFSHRAHGQRGTECGVCHGDTEHRGRPSMDQCVSCHKTQAGRRCVGCHLTTPGGRVRTRFGDQRLSPRSALAGMEHDGDWIVRHRWIAADNGEVCASCHTERDCIRCHDGRNRPLSVHPNDYLSLHPQQARRNQPRCVNCHNTQSFCIECHSRLGIATHSAPDLRATRRYHPPADVWIRGPVRHAPEAKRSLNACVSCHTESDCIQCHGSRAVGGRGLSPHPPGFRDSCLRPLQANSRPCQRCHGDLSALQTQCR